MRHGQLGDTACGISRADQTLAFIAAVMLVPSDRLVIQVRHRRQAPRGRAGTYRALVARSVEVRQRCAAGRLAAASLPAAPRPSPPLPPAPPPLTAPVP